MEYVKSNRSEAAVDNGDAEFRRLLATLPAAAYTCDAEGLITYFNAHAATLWGREPHLNNPVDRYCGSFKLFASDGAPLRHENCWMALALRENREFSGEEIVIERPDGSFRTVLANANPVHDEHGNVSGAVNVLVDITERKRMEIDVREADRRKVDFLAMLAHELRNPMAPICNGLQILRGARDERTREEALAMMERQSRQLVRLIDDLLDLSRINVGKVELRKQRIDIALAVQDAVEMCHPAIDEGGHSLHVELPPEPIHVDGDRNRLAQVFSNLLDNSAKFTKSPGRISISVERVGSDALIKVKDDGIGITPEMTESIFDMFTQLNQAPDGSQHGLGIGLSLVQGLVHKHDGSVEVQSAGPGKGTEFTVRLPVALSFEREMPPESGPNKVVHGLTPLRILVVDDNRDSARSMAMMLEISGHVLQTAHDGLEAVRGAQEFDPQVVLLDIGLPRLNGYDVCRRIREQPWGKGMVFIAQTGWGKDEDKRRALEAGFDYHIVKPVNPAELEKLLANLPLSPENPVIPPVSTPASNVELVAGT